MIQVSYSEIDTYRQCRFKHQLAYLEGWTPEGTSPALARGTAFHAILEAHYALIKSGVGGDVDGDFDLHRLKAVSAMPEDEVTLLEWMYDGYISKWGGDLDFEVVCTEQKLDYQIAPGITLHATIDLVLRMKSTGTLWIMDHKTCKTLPKQRELDLDDQLAIYIAVCRENGIDIFGGINNSIRTQRNIKPMTLEERFSRHLTFRNPDELERVVEDVRRLATEAYIPYKLPGTEDAVRSPNMDTCFWKCPFTEGCIHGRKYGPIKGRTFMLDSGFSIQTPHARIETPKELAMRRAQIEAAVNG